MFDEFHRPDRHDPSLEDCLPFLLAGGRGSRLYELTEAECKPAVPFGPALRIVDFVLAAARRARFRRMIVATQYRPDSLERYLAEVWAPAFPGGLSVRNGARLFAGIGGYAGTASAVAANLAEIDRIAPRDILVLAGDHVFDLDLGAMVAGHRAAGAEATVAVTPVPLAEARGFGILSADGSGRVTAFAEKPAAPAAMVGDPNRALASMGIYVFSWPWLRSLLVKALAIGGECDFGHHVMPQALDEGGLRIHAMPARADGRAGYWRDVGTLDAYRRCALDFAGGRPPFAPPVPPERPRLVPPLAGRPILAPERHGDLFGSVILPGAQMGRDCRLTRVILGRGAILPDGMVIGEDREEDARWFRRTDGGTTLVTQAMLERRSANRTPVRIIGGARRTAATTEA